MFDDNFDDFLNKDKKKIANTINILYSILFDPDTYHYTKRKEAYLFLYLSDPFIMKIEHNNIVLSIPAIIYDVLSFLKIYYNEDKAFKEFKSFYFPYLKDDWMKSFIKHKLMSEEFLDSNPEIKKIFNSNKPNKLTNPDNDLE